MKTYVVSLGCPKNLVDTEASVSLLRRAGCTMTDDPREAGLLVVSACSFLDAAALSFKDLTAAPPIRYL